MGERRFRRNPDVVERRIGDEVILVPTGSTIVDLQCLFTLNDTGAFIWEQLEKEKTFGQLAAAVEDEFDVTRGQAEKDLRVFLESLSREGCILEEEGG